MLPQQVMWYSTEPCGGFCFWSEIICNFLQLARTNVLVSQLSRVFVQEHILIAQCRDLLSTLASIHVRGTSRPIDLVFVCQSCWCSNCSRFNVAETGEVQQPASSKDTDEPNKASAFSIVSRARSGYTCSVSNCRTRLWLVKMKLC